jgi:hypothetical protein
MQPIYFPHTYITDESFNALSTCFQKITVYQPTLRHIPESMIRWRDSDQLEIRCPIREFETDIESSLKTYQHLGEFHQGRKGEVKNYQLSGIPFFDDISPQKIRADIVRQIQADEPQNQRLTPSTAQLVRTGLFLQMAQDLDSHDDVIKRNLAACAGMEKNLFKNLKEDDDSLFQELTSTPLPPANSTGEYRLKERLSAWTRLFFYDILINSERENFLPLPVLLITSSRFLFDEMVSEETDNTVFFSFDSKLLQHPSFFSALAEMAHATNPTSFREAQGPLDKEIPISLKISVVLNSPPLAFLARRAGILPSDVPNLPGRELQPNTLIGFIST